MGTRNNSNLFYTCSLIEYVGRIRKQTLYGSGFDGERNTGADL